MSKFKKFVGIYFGKQWQVVPREWILETGRKFYCYWPPNGDVEWQARKSTLPHTAKWTTFLVTKIAEESDDFSRCERKMTMGDVSHTDISASETERKRSGRPTLTSGIEENLLAASPQAFPVRQSAQLLGAGTSDSSSSESVVMEAKRHPAAVRPNTIRTGLTANNTELPSQNLCTSCETHMPEILATIRSMKSICSDTNLVVNELRDQRLTSAQSPAWPNIQPASTVEELEELMNTDYLVERLADAEHSSLQSTVRGMMKLLLTRELALRFSFTGMGARRLSTKESFKKHAAYERIMAALKSTKFATAKRPDINKAIMTSLKNVPDWDGQRDHRMRRRPATQRQAVASTANTTHVDADPGSSDIIPATPKRSPRIAKMGMVNDNKIFRTYDIYAGAKTVLNPGSSPDMIPPTPQRSPRFPKMANKMLQISDIYADANRVLNF